MGALLGPAFPPRLALAVSGGGDSMAMLHLAAGWARPMGIPLSVLTVDHGLRAASAAEAALVADEARGLGLPHEVLHWHWDGSGNLMEAARAARLDLMGRRLAGQGGAHLLLGHTRDDQAETFLLRLRRGSGVDGLGAMAPMRRAGGVTLVRPLLDTTRAELRHYLSALSIPYADDPTNDDESYDRIKMRRLLDTLEAAGIGRDRLAGTAGRMRRARDALSRRAHEAALEITADSHPADVVFDRDGLAALEPETRLRLIAGALQYVASATYRPRAGALEAAVERALGGAGSTLHGCRLIVTRGRLWITREGAAVAETAVRDGFWDHRWRVSDNLPNGLEVRPLAGADLAALGLSRPEGVPRAALDSAPALFDGDRPVAIPRLGYGDAGALRLDPPGGTYPQCLLSH